MTRLRADAVILNVPIILPVVALNMSLDDLITDFTPIVDNLLDYETTSFKGFNKLIEYLKVSEDKALKKIGNLTAYVSIKILSDLNTSSVVLEEKLEALKNVSVSVTEKIRARMRQFHTYVLDYYYSLKTSVLKEGLIAVLSRAITAEFMAVEQIFDINRELESNVNSNIGYGFATMKEVALNISKHESGNLSYIVT